MSLQSISANQNYLQLTMCPLLDHLEPRLILAYKHTNT